MSGRHVAPLTSSSIHRPHGAALRKAAQSFKAGDLATFYEALAVASFRERRVSVTLARPQDPDCPLIGVSEGFEAMTGYSRSEILGRNCRFLNSGCTINAEDRHGMRIAVRTGRTFTGVLQNRRKNGTVFRNLLHMSALRIGASTYILGVQADVTSLEVDLAKEETRAEIRNVVDEIFAVNVNAWASLQISQFGTTKLGGVVPYAESLLRPRAKLELYAKARDSFVSLEHGLLQNHLQDKNTFLEVYDTDDDPKTYLMGLRRVYSEPAFARFQQPQVATADPSPAAEPSTDLPSPAGEGQRAGGPPGSGPGRPRAPGPCRDEEEAPAWAPPPDAEQQPVRKKKSSKSTRGLQQDTEKLPSAPGKTRDKIQDKIRDKERDLSPNPEVANIPLPSIGSEKHPDGCTACSFHCYSLIGCSRGADCLFCHLDHPRKGRRRTKKKGRTRAEGDGLADPADGECSGEEPPVAGAVSAAGPAEPRRPSPAAEGPPRQVPQRGPPQPPQPPQPPPPLGLLPLLSSLEILAPLPALAALRPGGQGEKDEWEVMSLSYTEVSISMLVGQWRSILPFVSGPSQILKFSVFPVLPRGIRLEPATGVISGTAQRATRSSSPCAHMVVAEGPLGGAHVVVHIIVTDPLLEGGTLPGSAAFRERTPSED